MTVDSPAAPDPDPTPVQSRQPEARCKNCKTVVTGLAFCPACGQRTDTHVLTFRELLAEIADGLFNWDSRLWRSLVPLAIHPGKLTLAYLAGRRMYFLPPFRLYLILSVLFFLMPGDNLQVERVTGEGPGTSAAGNELPEVQDFDFEDIVGESTGDQALGQEIAGDVQRELDAAPEPPQSVNLLLGDGQNNCQVSGLEQNGLLAALIRNACLKARDDQEQLFGQLVDIIPVMMIVGIPLVALIMQFFYVFSGRYYVEHIIFLFHTHAFFFLVSTLIALSSLLGYYYPFLYEAMDWFRVIAAIWIPVYIFLAMLRVYGQSVGKTLLKAFFVLIGYGLCIVIVGTFSLLFTALQ